MKLFSEALKIAFLAITVMTTSCSGKVELLQGVSESEANEALAALLEAGISAGKLPGKEGAVGIEVASSEVARAISILKMEGLPKERYAKMGEVFRKEGLISSPLEERARYLWALSQELSATISQIDGVIKARVHVVLPERGAAGDPTLPSSAAVFIKHKAGVNLDDSVIQVKRLVANSITGLSADKVTVILLPAAQKLHTDQQTSDQNAPPNPGKVVSAGRAETGSSSFPMSFKTLLDESIFSQRFWIIAACVFILIVMLSFIFFVKKIKFSTKFFGRKQNVNETGEQLIR